MMSLSSVFLYGIDKSSFSMVTFSILCQVKRLIFFQFK